MADIEHVAILLFDGFETMDAFGPFEVFAVGASVGGDYEVSLRTIESAQEVRSSHGVGIVPDGTLEAADPDLIVVPGGGWGSRAERGAWAEAERGVVPEVIAAAAADGKIIAGVCTGGMLIERAGLLDGRPAVTHRGALDELRETDARVVDARVADGGPVLTAGGVTSGLDLALYVLEREFGADLARSVETHIEYERRGSVHRDA